MLASWQTLTTVDFARIIGVTPAALSLDLKNRINKAQLRYKRLNEEERDAVVLDILKKLDAAQFAKVGKHRREIWEQSWSQRYSIAQGSKFSFPSLIPDFINRHCIVRFCGQYVYTRNRKFELTFSEILRHWLFPKWLSQVSAVYEFGCGSGYNLLLLANLYPGIKLVGLDWSSSAIKLVKQLAHKHCANIHGRLFDVFKPDKAFSLNHGSAVLTMDALEQTGADYEQFLYYLLKQKPAVCLHVEPIAELYNQDILADYLALRYHRQRNYLDGFLSRLRQLEVRHLLEILDVRRVSFGSLYHDGYSVVVWRPL